MKQKVKKNKNEKQKTKNKKHTHTHTHTNQNQNTLKRKLKNVINLSNNPLKISKDLERYFFSKERKHVKSFVGQDKYKTFTKEQDGIIKYIGRI